MSLKSIFTFTFLSVLAACVANSNTDSSSDKSASKKPETETSPQSNGDMAKRSKVVLEFEPGKLKRPVQLIGMNGNTTAGPSWVNQTFFDQAVSIKPQALRYPGGRESSWWDWRAGWYAREWGNKRVEMPNWASKSSKGLKIGLDEVAPFIKAVDGELLFVLNMVTSTVQDQIEMLKYAEGIGIPINYIELGNEYNYPFEDVNAAFPTAKDYADACNEWITEIRKVYPKVKIGLVAGNRPKNDRAKNWHDALLEVKGADAYACHIYTQPESLMEDPQEAANGAVDELISQIEGRFRLFDMHEVPDDYEIWITEYNIHWVLMKRKDDDFGNRHTFNWMNVFRIMGMNHGLLKNKRVTMAVFHNIANYIDFAAIDTQGGTLDKLAAGIAMELWIKALDGMDDAQILTFNQDGVLGWVFTKGKQKRYLVVNYSKASMHLNTPITHRENPSSQQWHALPNHRVKNFEGISEKKEVVGENGIGIPPFSITIIE